MYRPKLIRHRRSSNAGTTPLKTAPSSLRVVFSTVWTRPQLSGPLFSVHSGDTPISTPTALAVCSIAAAEGDAPHSSKALLEPSDLSVRAYLTPLQQPRDPVSPAAGPQSKSARCVPHPLSGERRSSAAACSPVRLSHLHDQQLSFRRPAPSPPQSLYRLPPLPLGRGPNKASRSPCSRVYMLPV